MRRDRDGELIDEDDQAVELTHDAACVDGWLGEDYLGHPIPCLVCRPHLIARRRSHGHEVVR